MKPTTEKKAVHTQGPWKVTDDLYIQPTHAGYGAIARVYRDGFARSMYSLTGSPEANAQLMAAAPDLLAALRELLAHHDSIPAQYITEQGHQRADEARAAIAKAEGK